METSGLGSIHIGKLSLATIAGALVPFLSTLLAHGSTNTVTVVNSVIGAAVAGVALLTNGRVNLKPEQAEVEGIVDAVVSHGQPDVEGPGEAGDDTLPTPGELLESAPAAIAAAVKAIDPAAPAVPAAPAPAAPATDGNA
jgi:hypothetical protein